MSQIVDHNISDVTKRRAELRRRKILEQSESRMKKILFGDNKEELSEKISQHQLDVPTSGNLSSSEGNKLKLNEVTTASTDNQPRNRHANCEPCIDKNSVPSQIQKTFKQNSKEEQKSSTVQEQFPRKVSLISTPIDFKTLQESQLRNNSSFSFGNYFNEINFSNLVGTLFLVLTAVICSYLRFNLIIPFLITQLFRITLEPNRNTFHNISVITNQFAIFVFVYVLTQII